MRIFQIYVDWICDLRMDQTLLFIFVSYRYVSPLSSYICPIADNRMSKKLKKNIDFAVNYFILS